MTQKNALRVRKAALGVAIAVAFGTVTTETAQAAGLGALTVQSALGQPLKAEIELSSVTPEELQSLSVRLASQQIFKQAGIEFSPALTSLRFSLDKRDGRDVVRISSIQIINEPFLDLLVELNWANGRLVREYTFLLDPPELHAGKEPEPVSPVVAASLPPVQTPAQTSTPIVPSAVTSVSKPTPARTKSTTEIKVRSGDSLSKIAASHLPEGITLDQMLLALYRANPDSFVGNNMNRLKAGAILRVPEPADLLAVPAVEARKEVIAQSRDFASYRSHLAGMAARAGSLTGTSTDTQTKTLQGQVTPRVDNKATPKLDLKDQVKLARPETTAQSDPTGAGTAVSQADGAAAKEKALKEAKERVAELERNVSEIQKLLTQQNETMAKAQQASKSQPASLAPSLASAPLVVPPMTAEPAKAEPAKAEPAKAEPAKAEPAKAEPAKAEPAKAEPAKAEPAKAEPAKAEPAKAEPDKVPAAATISAEEGGGIVSQILENPLGLGAGALFLAFAGAGSFWYRRRQRKKLEQFHDAALPQAGVDLKPNSRLVTDSEKPLDSSDLADSSFNSSFTPSVSQIDSNEVDPIAEADVYIAYGRDPQAEEILREALKITPNRHAIRVKLLEIYSARKDLANFSSVAGELYQQTNGEGKDWERASELGRLMDPVNPLYARQADSVGESEPQQKLTVPESVASDFNEAQEDIAASIPVDYDLGAPTSSSAGAVPDVTSSVLTRPEDSLTRAEPRLGVTDNPALQATQPTPALDFSLETPSALADISASGASVESPKLSLDFDLNLPDSPAVPEPISPVDLSNISLDLDSGQAAPLPVSEAMSDDMGVNRQQEMATKLDLAAAYQEIGDREGAKELLDEVMQDGDAQQQERAQKLLQTLS